MRIAQLIMALNTMYVVYWLNSTISTKDELKR